MHVAFGRVRRKSRSVADDTDFADLGDLENRQVTGKSVSEVVYDHESEVGILR